jgi:hypothetical protein
MRAYSESSEEALRARDLLKEWSGEGFLTEAQYQLLQQETVCDLRRTNIFLRIVLFFFTLIIMAAGIALFFVIFLSHSNVQTTGIFLLIFAAIAYAAAELAVSQGRLYRYGIEEALAVCSIGFLCAGMQFALFEGGSSPAPHELEFLVPATGAIASLWIWRRFGLPYAFLAALIFLVFVPGYWTTSHTGQHLIILAFYAAGLIAIVALRRQYRFTYLNQEYSIAEALLWLGMYLAINLQLWSIDLPGHLWRGPDSPTEFSRPFYWTTWVLTWCLPPVVLARGLPGKDRLVMAVGAITAVLTMVTNKPYLGWPRHTWDPMLLGALLIGAAIFIRRWLAKGPGEIRRGFTARRLSGKDKTWMSVGATAFGIVAPSVITPSPQSSGSDVQFGGGDSGGAGASSDF